MTPKSEQTSSISHQKPVARSRSALALVYLVSTFAAGLGLVYAVDVNRPPAAGAQAAESASPEPVEAASVRRVALLEERSEHLKTELATAQGRIETLERRLGALKGEQLAMLETERGRIADELRTLIDARLSKSALVEPVAPAAPAESRLEQVLTRLGAESTPEGMRVTLAESELRFSPGRAELVSDAHAAGLVELATLLGERSELQILLRGHTDSSGAAETNLVLSERRAFAVRDALVELGVDETRIQAYGVGETRPVAENTTLEGRSRNRRVEVILAQP